MKTGNLVIKWFYVSDSSITYCAIYENDTQIATGRAALYFKDKFCKETGRKLSLSRALRIAGLSKEQRTKVWEDYRNMTPKKRW